MSEIFEKILNLKNDRKFISSTIRKEILDELLNKGISLSDIMIQYIIQQQKDIRDNVIEEIMSFIEVIGFPVFIENYFKELTEFINMLSKNFKIIKYPEKLKNLWKLVSNILGFLRVFLEIAENQKLGEIVKNLHNTSLDIQDQLAKKFYEVHEQGSQFLDYPAINKLIIMIKKQIKYETKSLEEIQITMEAQIYGFTQEQEDYKSFMMKMIQENEDIIEYIQGVLKEGKEKSNFSLLDQKLIREQIDYIIHKIEVLESNQNQIQSNKKESFIKSMNFGTDILLTEKYRPIHQRNFFIQFDEIGLDQDYTLEYQNMEFPFSTPDKQYIILKEICAFLNNQGGLMLFGIRDQDSKVFGVQLNFQKKDDFQFFFNGLKFYFDPQIRDEELQIIFMPVRKQYSQFFVQDRFVPIVVVNQGAEKDQLYTFKKKKVPQVQNFGQNIFAYQRIDAACYSFQYLELKREIESRVKNPMQQCQAIRVPIPIIKVEHDNEKHTMNRGAKSQKITQNQIAPSKTALLSGQNTNPQIIDLELIQNQILGQEQCQSLEIQDKKHKQKFLEDSSSQLLFDNLSPQKKSKPLRKKSQNFQENFISNMIEVEGEEQVEEVKGDQEEEQQQREIVFNSKHQIKLNIEQKSLGKDHLIVDSQQEGAILVESSFDGKLQNLKNNENMIDFQREEGFQKLNQVTILTQPQPSVYDFNKIQEELKKKKHVVVPTFNARLINKGQLQKDFKNHKQYCQIMVYSSQGRELMCQIQNDKLDKIYKTLHIGLIYSFTGGVATREERFKSTRKNGDDTELIFKDNLEINDVEESQANFPAFPFVLHDLNENEIKDKLQMIEYMNISFFAFIYSYPAEVDIKHKATIRTIKVFDNHLKLWQVTLWQELAQTFEPELNKLYLFYNFKIGYKNSFLTITTTRFSEVLDSHVDFNAVFKDRISYLLANQQELQTQMDNKEKVKIAKEILLDSQKFFEREKQSDEQLEFQIIGHIQCNIRDIHYYPICNGKNCSKRQIAYSTEQVKFVCETCKLGFEEPEFHLYANIIVKDDSGQIACYMPNFVLQFLIHMSGNQFKKEIGGEEFKRKIEQNFEKQYLMKISAQINQLETQNPYNEQITFALEKILQVMQPIVINEEIDYHDS